MKKIAKPRMKKTRKLKKSPVKPFLSHGWKPPIQWVVKAWRRPGKSLRRVARRTGFVKVKGKMIPAGLIEAREMQKAAIEAGWDSAEVIMEEILHPRGEKEKKVKKEERQTAFSLHEEEI